MNTSPNCTVVLLEDNTEVQVRGFGLVHPFHNPSPKSPQAKLCQSFPSSQGQDPHNLSAPSGLSCFLPLLQTLRAAYHARSCLGEQTWNSLSGTGLTCGQLLHFFPSLLSNVNLSATSCDDLCIKLQPWPLTSLIHISCFVLLSSHHLTHRLCM